MTEYDKALVERLKQWSTLVKRDYPQWINKETAIDHAADRIEALTAENERLRATVGDRMEFYLDRIEALTAENERLREALQNILDLQFGAEGYAKVIARAALEGKQ